MPRKNLRSSTRKGNVDKDWCKLHEGSPLPDESDADDVIPASVTKSNKKKKKADKKRRAKTALESKEMETVVPVCEESAADERSCIVNESEEGCDDVSSDVEDDDVREAEKSLQKLKIKESRLRREEKLQKIEEEAKRIRKSIKRRGTKTLTNADLRSMDDVRRGVDKFMDEKKLNFKKSESESDDGSSSGSSCRSDSSGSSESESERKKKEKSSDKKKKSGKESKLTSYVKFPQKWPHSHLKHHFVAKDKKYDDLSLAEFCAGYSSILRKCKSSKKARIEHLEELMYHATTKPWRHVLNYHAACLLEIERGNLKWGDNFQLCGVGNMTLYGTGSHSGSVRRDQNLESKQHNSGNDERVWFCKNFQRGACTFTRDHYGQLMGQNQLLKHICAKCWLTVKKQFPHSEQSESCPLFKVEL